MKRYYRFFGGFLDAQEKWLNDMAQNGYRLIKTGKVTYEFEKCQPGEYQYAIEFVANLSFKGEKEYRAFLEEFGYKVFYKNVNLSFSIGKIKWRPYGSGMGQISTNPGSYNKELLIVEKKNDGRPFELHTTNNSKASYYKPLRNAWLIVAAMFLIFTVWQFIQTGFVSKEIILLGLSGVLCSIPAVRYHNMISYYKACSNVEE
ncbi:MAG: DUF2812 domain-containing protein [Sedimentibacter sp.]|uniref:DUF2812 domain-containing protein n=1 Tax=Sedimentibacter sp. TaxID=1960295 RepID=UPI003158AF99